MNPIGLVITAVAALSAGIYLFWMEALQQIERDVRRSGGIH